MDAEVNACCLGYEVQNRHKQELRLQERGGGRLAWKYPRESEAAD